MKIDKKILGIIAIVLILLLLLFLFQEESPNNSYTPDEITEDTISSSVSGSKSKLPHMHYYEETAFFDECCRGFVTASLDYDWDYFFGEEIDECNEPVRIQITDSGGSVRWTDLQYEPTQETVEIRGYWDCSTAWEVYVINECSSSITFDWEITMVCD